MVEIIFMWVSRLTYVYTGYFLKHCISFLLAIQSSHLFHASCCSLCMFVAKHVMQHSLVFASCLSDVPCPHATCRSSHTTFAGILVARNLATSFFLAPADTALTLSPVARIVPSARAPASALASRRASEPASQRASRLASRRTSEPASQRAGEQASQRAGERVS